MAAKSVKVKFDQKALNESFEHHRELQFSEDFESKPSEENKVSRTANLFGDFYFTNETGGAKVLASKVVSQELKDLRERLQWGTLTQTSKAVPKEEFQVQLSKSKFLSLFLVMRRVTGRHQLALKKKAFKHWVEWLKAYLLLYRSRPQAMNHGHHGSRSSSPNGNRSIRFHGVGADEHGEHHHHPVHPHHYHHPHNYHFHGDKQTSPQQMRKELYLHHDIFLSSQDADVEQAVMHHLHPHASNHPEQEYRPVSKYHSPNRKPSLHKPDIKHAHAIVPSHIVPKHVVGSHGDGASHSHSQRSPSPGTSVVTSTTSASRQRISNLSPQQLRKELHLHHDIFLTSQDDIADAVLHRAHPHASNHPEREFKSDDAHHEHYHHHGASVPSHIVPKHHQRARSHSPVRPSSAPAGTAAGHGERSLSPQQLRKELYLHHDMFLSTQDDLADAVLHRTHPHSPNHPEQAAISRFASPKRRASMRLEAQKKQQQAHATVPSHIVPKHPEGQHRSRSPSPERGAGSADGGGGHHHHHHHHGDRSQSPQQLRKELYLHHDMFLSTQDDVAEAVLHRVHPHSPNKSPTQGHAGFDRSAEKGASPNRVRVSCRALDTLAGSRKDAKILHKGDPVAHVKNIAAGKHPSNITAKPISPSLYSSGAAPPVKPFNHTRDKKHDPKPRMSHSPTRHLPEEHATKVGIQVDPQDLRPGTPQRSLTRALSILVTPASDALKHDHRVDPTHHLRRTLNALAITGHDDIVGAVLPGSGLSVQDSAERKSGADSGSDSDYSSSDDGDLLEEAGHGGAEGSPSRLSGLDLTKGLSIRTDMSVDQDGGASVNTTSTSALRRASFTAPTVSHILKLAHKSDSVEKVAQKVKHKRSTVKQTLPKSPHPSATFPIIPDELVAKRAERRTSFRSPTKSHAIKVAAKLGGDDAVSVITGVSQQLSPDSPAKRKSFADSLPDRSVDGSEDAGMVSIRTIIPFSSFSGPATTVSTLVTAVSPATGTAKMVRRGSTAGSHAPPPRKPVYSPVAPTPSNKDAEKGKAAGGAVKFDPSLDEGDEAGGIVYSVNDDLDNLFSDPTSPSFRGSRSAAATPKVAEGIAAAVPAKYKPGTPKYNAYLKKVEKERNTKALDVIFTLLGRCQEKLGKTTSTKVAFAAWKGATGWMRNVEERVPQSVMYLLQIEREVLWRVFCVYCPQKHRIPFSPPNTSVTPVLSPEAVERLTTGYSAHHDHHAHTSAVSHPYHDIRHHEHHDAHPHKQPTQAQMRRDLYLHHDIFLDTTNDEDVAELELFKAHRHAMNHPEEGVVVHHEHHKHVVAPIAHHHDEAHHKPAQHEVNKKALHRDLHLHHDIFLTTEDKDLEEVDIKHNHPHAANHPEEGVVVHNGHITRPAPINISPIRKHGEVGAPSGPVRMDASLSPTPPQTPLYGLFTVIEGEGEDGGNHQDGHQVPKLRYGSPESGASPGDGAGAGGSGGKKNGSKPLELQVSHPHLSFPDGDAHAASEAVALRASTRFRKHLLDLDGLWHLMQDFNVVPYLFCKVKLGELFERCISLQPAAPEPAPAPQPDPLEKLPDFNVYSYDAPEKKDPGAQQTSGPDSPRGRRGSTESGVSAASSGAAKRQMKIQEAVAGNGTRRSFCSPDGKVQIKLTSFRAPGTVDATTPYIAAVTNPRSKSPAAVLTAAQKKKQDDDFVRAIIAANRKAAAEKVAEERTRRRSVGSRPSSAPAARAASPTSAGKRGRADKPKGMHIAPAEKEKRPSISPDRYRPIAELDLFKVEAHSPAKDHPMISFHSFHKLLWDIAASYMGLAAEEEEGQREEGEQGQKSAQEGVAEEAGAHEGEAGKGKSVDREDSHRLRAFKAFVHVMSRYKARMVTKEVEKVLPLLEHDHDLRHKALRLYK